MKKISLKLADVDVQLIKFVKKDDYEDFNVLEDRSSIDVVSEIDEVQRIQGQKPIGFFKQNDGSYILITHSKDELIDSTNRPK